MSTKVTWHGHATFDLETGGYRLLVDPYFSGNPLVKVDKNSVQADFILVTHGHGDHVGDTVEIAKRTGAMVIANTEIVRWLGKQGVQKTHPQHIGGGYQHPFGYLKLTQAFHGSSLPDGSYGGMPAGLLLTTKDGIKIYFAGDTGLFGDMALYGDEGIDLAFIPIGDNYTMGPEDALRAVRLLRPKIVVPIHYSTWDIIAQDVQAWASKAAEISKTQVQVLEPGDSISV
jgi:L-ascorbate metabolism protein UlaG (beta-lactamase superfamily)